MSTDKVLILGAGGLLGTGFARALGERAVPFNRAGLDLCDRVPLERALDANRPGLVINAAGLSRGTKEELFRINGLCAAGVAEACATRSVPMVFFSSSRVFGQDMAEPPTEAVEPAPADDYGWSKYRGEKLVLEAGAHYVVRLPMVLGFRRRHTDAQIVNRLIERGRAGFPVEVSRDVIHSPLHVSQAVAGVLALVGSGAAAGVYHVSGADTVALDRLVARLFAGLGLAGPLEPVEAARFEANPLHNLALGSEKLPPAGTWEQAAEQLVAEYRREASEF